MVTLEPVTSPLRIDETGTIRVGKTRVTLDVFVEAYQNDDSPHELAEQFETLSLADIHAAIAYYLNHKADLDRYLIRREAEADQIRKKIEDRQGPGLTKKVLLERLAKIQSAEKKA